MKLLVCLLGASLVTSGTSAQPFVWKSATPESQGFSAARLEGVRTNLAARGSKAFLVARNNAIVCEWYAPGHAADKPHYTASMAKGLVGGVAIAVALSDGRLALDDAAAKLIPQWRSDARKARITVRQLGSHTSGLEDAEAQGLSHEELTGWKGDFWKRLAPPRDPFTIARDVTPVLDEPGTAHRYSNPGIAMLGYVLTAALRDAAEKDLRTLLRDRLMRPLGVPDGEWSVGYGKTDTVDGLPLIGAWGGGSYTVRAVARVGRLMLREGDWEGQQLIQRQAVRAVTTDAGTPGHNGIGFWSNKDGACPPLARDAFWASGAGHQVLLVVPSLQLIAVRNGALLDRAAGYDRALYEQLFIPLMGALLEKPSTSATQAPTVSAYPPSAVVKSLEWAPRESIVRRAHGSDNWPLTWADDDALYGAYGDGNGFEPFTPEKLSLGFARITGTPPAFVGTNIRAPTGEARGPGPAGKKASGLLCVDGTLHLWARNATNAQLAWSSDHGTTWSWAEWRFTRSFGCPTFLNFGRNYAGARDEFVYIYSPDAESAYVPADRFILARVPKSRLRERDAYEVFVGFNSVGQPRWSGDLDRPAAVLAQPARCYRPSVTFNAGLKRYLLVQAVPGVASRDPEGRIDTRRWGGLAVYDAPEPWGPWTTVFFADHWDTGPGDAASFPSKWISADGLTLWLAFSGEDAFSIRGARLRLH